MQLNALIRQTRLLPSEYRLKRDRDLAYLMELKEENLLFSYYTEGFGGCQGFFRALSFRQFAGIFSCILLAERLSVKYSGPLRATASAIPDNTYF